MLRYTEFCLSNNEVPGESSICVYISGCLNGCRNCHYPELKSNSYGLILSNHYKDIMLLYLEQATCVCFLGEGKNRFIEKLELYRYTRYAKKLGLKTCLYSGRNTIVEAWMNIFDYVKTGAYIEALGPLTETATNQRFWQKKSTGWEDRTEIFWNF